jgi:hypothetical protein
MAGHDRTVAFLRDGDSVDRKRLRLAETAKYLKIAHAENGYERQAQHYYVLERRQRRKAMRGSVILWIRRIQDFVYGDLVWRYGSSVLRPVLTFALSALVAAGITFAAPMTDGGATGLHPGATTGAYSFEGWNGQSVVNYLNVLYFFLTAPAGGSQDSLHGWVKGIFVFYLLMTLWLIALTFEASAKRLGKSI